MGTPIRPDRRRAETTPLPPELEARFQKWLIANRVTDLDDPRSYYDYRGAFLAGIGRAPGEEGHFPDTFKQHGHPSFSIESKYAATPYDGGLWRGEDYSAQALTRADSTEREKVWREHHPQPKGAAYWANRWDVLVKAGMAPEAATQKLLGEGAPPPLKETPSTPETNVTASTTGAASNGERPGGFLRSALQGLSFGFSDEALAAIRAMGSPVKTRGAPEESATALGDLTRTPEYGGAVADERGRLAEYRGAHPWKSGAAMLAGGLASAPLLGGASAPVAGMRGMVQAGARVGAIGGALAGAGGAEGGAVERVPGAALGGTMGAFFGAAVPPLVRGIQATGQRFLPAPAAAEPAGVTLHANPLAPAVMAARRAMFGTVDDNANDLMLRAFERDATSVDALRAKAAEAAAKGAKPETVMEFAGDNTRGLARGATALPSKAKQMIPAEMAARSEGAEDRVLSDLMESTGGARRNVLDDIDEIAHRRAADADAMYGAIRGAPVDDPALARLLANPTVRRAYERARTIVQNGIDAGEAGEPLPALGALVDESGALRGPITLGTVDQIKRGLDDLLDGLRRAPGAHHGGDDVGGLGRESLASIAKLKGALVEIADRAVPAYKDARSAFAGKTAMIQAMEEGKMLFAGHHATPIQQAEKMVREMGASELEAYRKGALEALSEQVESIRPGLDVNRRIADRTIDRRRLRLLFDTDESFEAFRDQLTREARMHATRQFVTGNSQTANKLAELAEIAGVDIGDVMRGVSNPAGLAAKLAASALSQRMKGVTTATADALAPKMLAGSKGGGAATDDLMALLDNLAKAQARVAERRAGAARAGAAAGAFAPRLNQPNR